MIVAWSQLPLAALIDTGPEEAACVRVIVHHGGPGREALNLRINQGAHREPDTFVLSVILLPATIARELEIACDAQYLLCTHSGPGDHLCSGAEHWL